MKAMGRWDAKLQRITTDAEDVRSDMDFTGQRIWGFHIYRCTYSSCSDWARFVELLRQKTHENLQGNELLASLVLTVHDDPASLAGASIDLVRCQFRDWVQSEESAAEQQGARGRNLGSRYMYCVHVDQESLDSMPTKHPYVNLIDSRWGIPIPEAERDPDCYQEFQGQGDEEWPGSMKIAVDALLPGAYARFENKNIWYVDNRDPLNIWGDPWSGKKYEKCT